MGRSDRRHPAPVPRFDNRRDRGWVGEAPTHVVGQADHGPHHLMAKGVGLDPEGQQVSFFHPSRLVHPPGVVTALDGTAETGEVVLT